MAGSTAEKKKRRKRRKTRGQFYDFSLLFVILFLLCFGLVMIYSTSYYTAQLKLGDGTYYLRRQALITAGSLVVMFVISRIDYHVWVKFAVPAYVAAVALMILVNYTSFGIEYNGQKRWFGIAGHSLFQPTELVKLALILVMAVLIVKLEPAIDLWRVRFLLIVIAAIPTYLVLKNNLSSGIIIAGIVVIMYFVASKKKAVFAVLAVAVVALALVVVIGGDYFVEAGLIESYQLERIYVWQNPTAYATEGGYQVLQGLYAIGSGGLFGKGLGNSSQKLGFVPEAQNDMIFSIICEELGVIGGICVILLFLFLIYRFVVIAFNAPDLLGAMLVVGAMAHISIQVILNIAVVTNTIPNTGITLPFISYGGTSVMFLLAEMGLVLSVSNQIVVKEPAEADQRRSRRSRSAVRRTARAQ